MRRTVAACALLSSGLLAGAFGYGWANVVPAFAHAPLGVHLAFRVELMKWNAPTMQALMGLSILSSVCFALTVRSVARGLAVGAALLNLTAALITKYGNVPINLRIKQWDSTALPSDYAAQLHSWDTFNVARVAAALVAFTLIIIAAQVAPRQRSTDGTSVPGDPDRAAEPADTSPLRHTSVPTSPRQPSVGEGDREK